MKLREEPYFKPLCIGVIALCVLLSLWMAAAVFSRLAEANRGSLEAAQQQRLEEELSIAELGASSNANWEAIVVNNQQIAQKKQEQADLTNHLKGYSGERTRLNIYEQEIASVLVYGEDMRAAALPVFTPNYDRSVPSEVAAGKDVFFYPQLVTAFALQELPEGGRRPVLEQVNQYAEETLQPLLDQLGADQRELDARMQTLSDYLAACRTGADIFLRLDFLDQLAGDGLQEYLYGERVEEMTASLWELHYRYENAAKLYELALTDTPANQAYIQALRDAAASLEPLLEEYDPYQALVSQSQIDRWRVETIDLYRELADELAALSTIQGGMEAAGRLSVQVGEVEYRIEGGRKGAVLLTFWEEDLGENERIAWHYFDKDGELLLTVRADGRRAYRFEGEECSAPGAPSGTLQWERQVENSLWLHDQLEAGEAPAAEDYRSRMLS